MNESDQIETTDNDLQVWSEFEHLDTTQRTETNIFTLQFIDELCSDAFEFRTIEEHNLCANYKTNLIDQEMQFSSIFFINLVLGLIVGYIAIRGLFDPWRN